MSWKIFKHKIKQGSSLIFLTVFLVEAAAPLGISISNAAALHADKELTEEIRGREAVIATHSFVQKVATPSKAATSKPEKKITVEEMKEEIRLEFEDMEVQKEGGWDIFEERSSSDSDCSSGKFFFMQSYSMHKGLSGTFQFEAPAGSFNLYVQTKDNQDRGIFQFSLNGAELGEPVDFWSEEAGYERHDLGKVELNEGQNELNLNLKGSRLENAKIFGLVLDSLLLIPSGKIPPPIISTVERVTPDMDGVEKKGNWNLSAIPLSNGEGQSLYGSNPDSYVKYPSALAVSEEGWYEVSFWNIAREQAKMKMRAEVSNAKGIVKCDLPAVASDQWSEIGIWYFTGEKDEYVKLEIFESGLWSRVADIQFKRTEKPKETQTFIWKNEDSFYSETKGTWIEGDGGFQETKLRVSSEKDAQAQWSEYAPVTGNLKVSYWIPAEMPDDVGSILYDIVSQDGNWRGRLNLSTVEKGAWNKLCTIEASEGTVLNIEINATSNKAVYLDAIQLMTTREMPDEVYVPEQIGSTEPRIYVNQLGYDNGSAKRATAMNFSDGTPFYVKDKESGKTLYEGHVAGFIADFSELDAPKGERIEAYLEIDGVKSYVFEIGRYLLAMKTTVPALKFMVETRQDYVLGGNSGYGWRDSHQFSFELNSLVLQYMANPSLYNRITGGISDAKKTKIDELKIQGEDEPDIVWLMRFAARQYMNYGKKQGKKLHLLIKEQLAYYLYIYPEIRQWESPEFYEELRNYVLDTWGDPYCTLQWYPVPNTTHDLYALQTAFGGLKGSQPPGHSIIPNLMMYEVALRDDLSEETAQKFFDAAYENCEYVIDGIDINDPYYAKGQRMSEHIVMTSLAYFQEMYPDRAPERLLETIRTWADKTILRADNFWDTRMAVSEKAGDLDQYDFFTSGKAIKKQYWTGAAYAVADGQNPAPKNEPGNIAGMQAITYAASRVLDGDSERIDALKRIGVAGIDDLFGRNPSGLAAFYHVTRDFEGGDKGWYRQYQGGNGILQNCTAVIDANTPEACYPYTPENYKAGYTEGWVAYNTAWNISLAYAAADAIALSVSDTEAEVGEEITVQLDAPLGIDDKKVESGEVLLTYHSGKEEELLLIGDGKIENSYFAKFVLPEGEDSVQISYGYGIFREEINVQILSKEEKRQEKLNKLEVGVLQAISESI